MFGLGIVDTLELAITLVFVIPIGLFGVQQLLAGNPLYGVVGVGCAVAMILLERFVWTPADVPGNVAERIADRVVIDPDDSEE